VIAMSDIIAIGAMKAAQDEGLHIPQDLSVVGFDDIMQARLISPALTTVSQPSSEKGRLAADMLVQLIESSVEPKHILLPTQLVVRESVCPPHLK
jgi:LacI family transcriptional regulator